MVIEFECPHCKTKLKAGVNLAGQKGTCPSCSKELTVPESDKAASPETEEATQTADKGDHQEGAQ